MNSQFWKHCFTTSKWLHQDPHFPSQSSWNRHTAFPPKMRNEVESLAKWCFIWPRSISQNCINVATSKEACKDITPPEFPSHREPSLLFRETVQICYVNRACNSTKGLEGYNYVSKALVGSVVWWLKSQGEGKLLDDPSQITPEKKGNQPL